jgi:hypothetical protein
MVFASQKRSRRLGGSVCHQMNERRGKRWPARRRAVMMSQSDWADCQKCPRQRHIVARLPQVFTYSRVVPRYRRYSGGGRMEYQGFVVDAFERDPGKWRAKLSRSSGRPLITGRKKIWRFVTGVDATTASAALLIALAAIDAGTFARAASLPEKFWRRRGRRSNVSVRVVPQAKRGTRHIERARYRRASTAELSNK